MNAGTLQLISIIAFSLAGVLTLISIYLFFKMDVRGIIDDLSGKSAERQIMAMREENNRQKNPLSKRSAKSSETRKSSLMERTTVELKNDDVGVKRSFVPNGCLRIAPAANAARAHAMRGSVACCFERPE